MLVKKEFVYYSNGKPIKFNRGEEVGETELYKLWELYEDKKRKPTATFVQPLWLDTNEVIHLTSEESSVLDYFKILQYEKSLAGIVYLVSTYRNYINKNKNI